MARFYAMLYCFENGVRNLIQDRLQEISGNEWWEKKIPESIKRTATKKQTKATSQPWLEGEKSNLLSFVGFGDLADIIGHNWDDFQHLIPTQHWLKQRMIELEEARNFVAHNRLLQEEEFTRLETYIADWIKQVGS